MTIIDMIGIGLLALVFAVVLFLVLAAMFESAKRRDQRRQEIVKEENEILDRIRQKYKTVKTTRQMQNVSQPAQVYYDVDSYSSSTDSYDSGSDSDCGGDSGGGDGGSCD